MKDYYLHLIPSVSHKVNKTAELICERCKNKFTVAFWMVKRGRRFCSHACRKADPLDRLMERIKKDENGCWNYTGVIGWGGYGQIKINGTMKSAHRVMWILWNKKPVPHGMVVRHTCVGNRSCINPDHLILGTQKQNMQDCIKQGRFHGRSSIVTPENVECIKMARNPTDGSKPVPYRKLAEMLGLGRESVWWAANKRQNC